MSYLHILYLIVGGLTCFFIELLSISSLRENQLKAATRSSSLFILFALLWFGSYFVFSPADVVLAAAVAVVLVFIILFYLPTGRTRSIKAGPVTKRYDERDVIFSREEYEPGTEKYEQYYAQRPHYKAIDDKMRSLPELLAPGGRYYDPVGSKKIDAVFERIEKLTTKVDGPTANSREEIDPSEMTGRMKQKVLQMGADEIGVAELNPMFIYSHVGRGPEKWGEPITNRHKYAIVFSVEMRYDPVQLAPGLAITEETADRYLLAANISIGLADYIRSLGYPARAHISGSNYQIILPAVAHDAGLGELGRMGYLISPKLGARIRLGAVTTDLPLLPDKPISFGVQDFCAKCLKCAANCPSGAIPSGETSDIRGVGKWALNVEKCLHYWRAIGTDCGICMKVCPYSHPPTIIHNLVRKGIRHSAFARRVSIRGDDFIYGKKPSFL